MTRAALERLSTDLGERSTYDAASQCSRCGYCEQACPTYVATGSELKSPRGRNQLVRLIWEGGLRDPAAAEQALSSCLLCGACSTACYAHVPTADIVLEGRRRIGAHWLARRLAAHPSWLPKALKAALWLKRLGLSRLARPFLKRLGLKGLASADEHLAEAPSRFLCEELKERARPLSPAWLYFAACGTHYLYPRVGRATVRLLEAQGPGLCLDFRCCGLMAYNYGSLEDARKLARAVIEGSEPFPAPVVADCSSCAAFLKKYPQLFLDDAPWRTRAEAFAARVRDSIEAVGSTEGLTPWRGGVVTYHDSCRACHGQGLAGPRERLKAVCGGSWRELPESDVCCGGAGAFAFTQPELSDEVLRRKIGRIAALRASVVLTSSTSCLAQLAHGFKKYYPDATVRHLSEFLAERLPNPPPHGT
ncbi:MAG: (Fe-S)-binding protein [Elusimicrobia bacterium]|nr:(Fe-S)-binding protein [Elusimicrobiota bacterium]